VIESEDDMVAMFYYMLVNNLEIMEVVFDYDYLVEVDKDAGGSGKNVDHMLTSLTTLMKSKKFLSQYLFLQHNYYPTIIYNSSGETGLIMVLENNLLIDAPSEVGHLVQFFSHYHVYGTYDFYIEDTILKTSNGSNDLAKAQNLFASSISQYDVNIEFTLIESSSQASDGRAYYKIVVSPKSV